MSMELCSHGSLVDYIIENGPFNDDLLLKHLLLQICKGVDAIHTTANYAHLDIKPDNILIGDDYLLKMTDFGLAQPTTQEIIKQYGTEGYTAPEIPNRKEHRFYKGV